MDNLLKSQHPIVEAEAYEPPRMTVVPVRCGGAMLIGSAQQYINNAEFSNYFQDVMDIENASDDAMGFGDSFDPVSDYRWGDDFF